MKFVSTLEIFLFDALFFEEYRMYYSISLFKIKFFVLHCNSAGLEHRFSACSPAPHS